MAKITDKDLVQTWAAEARMYKKVAVLVEDLRDMPFWRNMLYNLGHTPIIADFPYKSAAGKNDIERFVDYLAIEHVAGHILLCRDSDNEYFYQSKPYLSKPYVLQTYAYSIENIKSYPPHLTQICEDICLLTYDFEGFFQQYSEIIFPVFCYYLYFHQEKYPENWKDLISVKKITEVIALAHLDKNEQYKWIETPDKEQDIADLFKILQQKVRDFVAEMEAILAENSLLDFAKEKLIFIQEEIKQLIPFSNPSSHIFNFINGHLIWDKVTLPLFQKIISLKTAEYITTLSPEKHNEYLNLVAEKDIFSLLDDSYKYHFQTKMPKCPLVRKIQQDIHKIFPSK